ncbi:MAG TPA: glycosyltransferase family 25 protein [Trebonia sp.]|jgi:glycosyl transferase family 25|nr:glycosyltransferase family 25 protein [Trebonia sp.]
MAKHSTVGGAPLRGYVVNLERSVNRRHHMRRELRKARFDVEFVTAVDGRQLDITDPQLVSPELQSRPSFRAGSAGCALSHLEIYRRVLAAELEHVVVMEDDIVIPPDMDALCTEVARGMRGAGVVLLNYHGKRGATRLVQQGSRGLAGSRVLADVADEASSTGCYMITREACKRILAGQSVLVAFPDQWAYFYRQGWIESLQCVAPMPVMNSPELRTSIDHFKHDSLKARIREIISESKLPVVHQVLAMRRRRSFQKRGWAGEVEFVDERTLRAPGDGAAVDVEPPEMPAAPARHS